jgi:steroid delta-isomerase
MGKAGDTVAADTMRDRIDLYLARYTGGDREGWLDLFAADARIEDPVGSPPQCGRVAIGAFYDYTHAAAERIEMAPLFLAVCGNEVAFHMRVRVLLQGTWVEFDAIDVMAFDAHGKIAAMKAFWDPGAVAAPSGSEA